MIREQTRFGYINVVDIQSVPAVPVQQGISTLLTMHDWWAEEWWNH